jgi:hypothetical protein
MRRLVADTVALIVFCTVAAGMVEVLVVGLSAAQLVQTRLAAIPAIVFTARPYGLWRDMIFRWFGAAEGGPARAAMFDIVAFVSFQAPVYATILYFAGASIEQIALAIPSAAVAMVMAGRPYGVFLEWVRSLFGAGASADVLPLSEGQDPQVPPQKP